MDDKPVFSSSNNSGSVPTPQPTDVPLAPISVSNPEDVSTEPVTSTPFEQKPSSIWEPQRIENPSVSPHIEESNLSSPQEQEVYSPSSSESLPPPPSNRLSFLSLENIVKILVGIAVVVILFLLIFKVIPGLFNKGNNNVTLTYWGLWEDISTMKVVIADFEKENPNIKINYSKQDVKQYREKIATRIQNGTGTDIFAIHNTWLPMFKATLAPLPSDAVTKEEFTRDFYPTVQKDLVQNGAIYAVPLGIDTLAMYVNTDLLQAAGLPVPTNWQDFITASRQLTVKDESGKIQTAGAALGTYDNITHAPDIVSLLLVQNRANLADLGSTSKQVGDALYFYTSFATGEGNVWDTTLDPSILSFAKGSLAMYFGYSWDFFAIKEANPNLQFSVVPVPHLPGQSQTIASYWAQGVSSKSKHQKEAFLFMKYLVRKETEQKLYATQSKKRFFGQPYARVDLKESLKDNPSVYPFVSQAPDAVSSYFASDTYDDALNSQMNVYLGNAVRSMLNDASPATAADTLIQGVTQIMKKYGK